MKECPVVFKEVLKQAENLVLSNPSDEQVVAVLTSKGHIHCFINHGVISGNTADETDFVKTLAESGDTQIRYAVCMWSDSTLDVPSHHLRNLLVGLNSDNREAEFLLKGSEGFNTKPLKAMIPPEK